MLDQRVRYEAELKSRSAMRDAGLSDQRKRKLRLEIDELKKKKKLLKLELENMNSESERLYEKAEVSGKIEHVASANSIRLEIKVQNFR